MKLHIEHETVFHYNEPVCEAVGEVRLQPYDHDGQWLINFRLALDPPTGFERITDRFGNAIHCYSVLPPHHQLTITAQSLVETSNTPLLAATAISLLERHEFCTPSKFVPLNDALADFARQHTPSDANAEASAYALMHAIANNFVYERGSTDISTTADAVLAGGRGVCQDFAHLLIALCRSQGLPARYVSGYFYDPALPPETVLASHAWAEVFLEGRGWLALDPTHNCAIGPQYVRVAVGRDYADAAPMHGVYQGSGHETLKVRVFIRVADMQPTTTP
ncbi:MAG: transglutaminase family protein [Chloroflexi bacterium SZAS-1]|jgi:transglutaminase-like putative cysteine protease|nr:transglutaminase family protein [Chloroflexi bacterium SZAS-1]HNP84710.1 transglutaminase family protein [Kouleothrix sp.]